MMPFRNGCVVDWDHKVDIKQFLSEDGSEEAVRAAAVGVRCELRKLEGAFPENTDAGDELADIIADLDTTDQQEFNNVLEALYDWADYNLVWLG